MSEVNYQIAKEFNSIHIIDEKSGDYKWVGKPHPQFSLTLLEFGAHYDVFSGPKSIFGIILGLTAIGTYIFYSLDNLIAMILTICFGLFCIVYPDIRKHQRKKKTKYAFSDDKVFFQIYRGGRTQRHELEYTEIKKITAQIFNNGKGTIYFVPYSKQPFFTKDFSWGKRRHYPTFEIIDNAREVYREVEQLRINSIKRNR